LGGLLVEITILLALSRRDTAQTLRDAAQAYKVDVEAIAQKVKQEFAAKEKAKKVKKPVAATTPAKVKKSA
jgi:ParB family chromosome partitioning protein